MSSSHARTDLACRNCGTQAPLDFCPACGQETALHPPTLGEFLHEFAGHYVALEGALWRSLSLLVLRPGRLTLEYLAGRRRRYVLPLRLYLTASFLFFLVLKLLPNSFEPTSDVELELNRGAPAVYQDADDDDLPEAASGALPARPLAAAASAAAARLAASQAGAASGAASGLAPVGAAAASGQAALPPHAAASDGRPSSRAVDCGVAGEPPCGVVERYFNSVSERFSKDAPGTLKQLRARLMSAAPYAVFFLLPAFSGIVMLAYRGRRMTYGEHVVFSLHLHAFWFLALLMIAVLPAAVGEWLWLAVPVYGVWAQRTVYGGSWGKTLLRALFISVFYGAVLLAATAALVLALLAA